MNEPSRLIADARIRLADTPRVRLGEQAQTRRMLGLARVPRILPVAAAWHVGVLLLGEDFLAATGEVFRAREEAIRGYTATAQRERSERAAAAFRGGFAEGEVVHLGWEVLDLELVAGGGTSGPLSGSAGIPEIRWSARAPSRPLADYLDEQIALRQ